MVCFMIAFDNEKLLVDSDLKSALDMKLKHSLENVFHTYVFFLWLTIRRISFLFLLFDIYNAVTVVASFSLYTFSR